MTTYLKDIDYETNKSEMTICLTNKQFDGEIRKCYVDISFKFGRQCSERVPGLIAEFHQEINQTIMWTEYDIDALYDQINNMLSCDMNKESYYWLTLVAEQEFEALCFLSEYENETYVTLFVSVGINSMGPAIKLTTSKSTLIQWVTELKQEFYRGTKKDV